MIVQNATACPELIDETCGKVIEKNDYQGMKVAISEILDKNISAENCLKRSELFNKEENYQQYIDLYRRTIKEEQYEK